MARKSVFLNDKGRELAHNFEMLNRILSLAVAVTLFGSACSKPGLKSDTGTKSSPITATESPTPEPPMTEIDGRPTTPPSPTPIPTGTAAAALDEFKSAEKEVFDNDQVRFNLDPKIWNKISDEEGIQTYEKAQSNDSVVAFRGEAVIPANLLKIATVLNKPELRKEWIDALVETHQIEMTSPFDRIEYNHTKVPWPFQDRDFVYRINVQVNRTPPTMLITMKSIVDPREPDHSGIVRGQILYSYYYLKQVPGVRATKVVVEMALDPKGAIPKWLVTLSQKKWPFNTLLALKKVSQREDLVVSQDIADYFNKKEPTKTKKVAKKKSRKKIRRKPGGK